MRRPTGCPGGAGAACAGGVPAGAGRRYRLFLRQWGEGHARRTGCGEATPGAVTAGGKILNPGSALRSSPQPSPREQGPGVHPGSSGGWVPTRQRGLALVTAVLIVAIVAAIAASLGLGQQVWLRQAQNFNDRAQAEKVAEGALQVAIITLNDDAKKGGATDDLTEDWARVLPPMQADAGLVQGQITDAQGLFNLNDLLRAGQDSTPDIGVYRRLLQSLGLNDTQLIDPLLDWMDPNSQARAAGAEDIYYFTLQPPYRTANQPLQSVDELRLVRGYDARIVDLLRPYVTALPEATAVNINTASAQVLSALFKTALPLSTAQQLVEQRDKNRSPFKSVDELVQRAGGQEIEKGVADVKSAYFLVQVNTSFGRLQRGRQTLVHRLPNSDPAVLWQVNLLGLPPPAAPPPS